MAQITRLHEALTLAEWKALDLDRPLTDEPVGARTDARRSHNAKCSAIYDTPDSPVDRAIRSKEKR